MGIFILRFIIIAIITTSGYFFPPFQLKNYIGAGVAMILGVVIVYLETRIYFLGLGPRQAPHDSKLVVRSL